MLQLEPDSGVFSCFFAIGLSPLFQRLAFIGLSFDVPAARVAQIHSDDSFHGLLGWDSLPSCFLGVIFRLPDLSTGC